MAQNKIEVFLDYWPNIFESNFWNPRCSLCLSLVLDYNSKIKIHDFVICRLKFGKLRLQSVYRLKCLSKVLHFGKGSQTPKVSRFDRTSLRNSEVVPRFDRTSLRNLEVEHFFKISLLVIESWSSRSPFQFSSYPVIPSCPEFSLP